jgi:hypothetical protein
LCPPPMWRQVMRPLLFRPPVFLIGRIRLLSGSLFVMSSNADVVMNLRPGDVGLYLLIAMF